MNRLLSVAALSCVGVLVASCNPLEPGLTACTLIGCSSGLTVELEGRPTAPFTVTATAGETTETIHCEERAGCGWLLFRDFTPAEVTVTYASGDESIERTFTPTYTRSRPNGEGCPPECVNGTVVLEIS